MIPYEKENWLALKAKATELFKTSCASVVWHILYPLSQRKSLGSRSILLGIEGGHFFGDLQGIKVNLLQDEERKLLCAK